MDFIVTIAEQGPDLWDIGAGSIYHIQDTGFPGSDGGRKFSIGSSDHGGLITRGMNPYLTLPLSFGAGCWRASVLA